MNASSQLENDLRILKRSLRGSKESLVSQRDLYILLAYLAFSAACAAPLALPLGSGLRVLLGTLLLAAFLGITRKTVARVRSLGEFEQLIAYRSLAAGGLVAVWFVLFAGVAAVAVGYDNLLLVMALGPPELWICSALFARGAEQAYLQPVEGSGG